MLCSWPSWGRQMPCNQGVINPGGFWVLPRREQEKEGHRETMPGDTHHAYALPPAPGSISIWGEPRGHRTLSPPHHATVCFFLLFPRQSCLSCLFSLYFLLYLPTRVFSSRVSPDGKRHNPNAGGLVETCRWWNHRNPVEKKDRHGNKGGFHVCCDLPYPSPEWHWGNWLENEQKFDKLHNKPQQCSWSKEKQESLLYGVQYIWIFIQPLDGTADRELLTGSPLSLYGELLSFPVLSLHFLLLVLSYVTFSSTQLLNRTEAVRCEGQSEVWIGTLWRIIRLDIRQCVHTYTHTQTDTGLTYAIPLSFNDAVVKDFVFWSLRSVSQFGIRAQKINIGKHYLSYSTSASAC